MANTESNMELDLHNRVNYEAKVMTNTMDGDRWFSTEINFFASCCCEKRIASGIIWLSDINNPTHSTVSMQNGKFEEKALYDSSHGA